MKHLTKKLESVEKGVYKELSPEERAGLVLKAIAQGKEKVVEGLVETCPKYTYKMIDQRYRYNALIQFLAIRGVYESILEAYLRLLLTLHSLGYEDHEEFNPDQEIYENSFWRTFFAYQNTYVELNGILQGFENYCEEIGVEPIKLLESIGLTPFGSSMYTMLSKNLTKMSKEIRKENIEEINELANETKQHLKKPEEDNKRTKGKSSSLS